MNLCGLLTAGPEEAFHQCKCSYFVEPSQVYTQRLRLRETRGILFQSKTLKTKDRKERKSDGRVNNT